MPLVGEEKLAYQRRWIAARRTKALEYLGNKCVKCSDEEGLEFDHVDPKQKKRNISSLLSGSWTKLVVELDKCQLLCRECHQDKTIASYTEPEHGTLSRYSGRKYKCKCELCKEAMRVYQARRRQSLGKK